VPVAVQSIGVANVESEMVIALGVVVIVVNAGAKPDQ
jgi:hypothetical protein